MIAYHSGLNSSHLTRRFLQVLHPDLDLICVRRGFEMCDIRLRAPCVGVDNEVLC